MESKAEYLFAQLRVRKVDTLFGNTHEYRTSEIGCRKALIGAILIDVDEKEREEKQRFEL